jgi:hypothetical protein
MVNNRWPMDGLQWIRRSTSSEIPNPCRPFASSRRTVHRTGRLALPLDRPIDSTLVFQDALFVVQMPRNGASK